MPPLADPFVEMHATGNTRLDHALRGFTQARGLAVLVLEQIACGDAEGARVAYPPMMLFESAAAAARYAARVAAALHGQLEFGPMRPRGARPPVRKALAAVAARAGRFDLKAVIEVIRLLAAEPAAGPLEDESLARLRQAVHDQGIRFVGVDGTQIRYAHHGHTHLPLSFRQLGDALMEIRQAARLA